MRSITVPDSLALPLAGAAMQGNNANNQQMGSMPGMMPMGMGMPMMGMPAMMGMPMMNPMMAMPMMNPMMACGNAGNIHNVAAPAATAAPMGAANLSSLKTQPPVLGTTGGLMPPKVETQRHLEPGRVSVPNVSIPSVPMQRERSRSRDLEPPPPAEEKAPEPVREKTPPRCHLHNTKKPNAKCKFCQKWLACQAQAEKHEEKDGKEEKPKVVVTHPDEEEDYSRRTFKCSTLLKDQIFGSSYFKSLLEVTDLELLTAEIAKYADTLDVYNSGNTVHPSCFICQVYRLFTLPQSEDLEDLLAILDASPSAKVRCAGILYVRFVVPPHKLWEKLEENLFDEQELKYLDGDKQVTTTIHEYVENLLIKDKYYNTPLPRIPVKVRQHLEKELAPLSQFRKRLAAMQKALPKKVAGTAVEVYVDGRWHRGHIKQFVGNHKRKVGIVLENGAMVSSHLGKVVLRDEEPEKQADKDEKKEGEDEKAEEKSQGKKEKKEKKEKETRPSSSRSRSRSRHRSRSRRRSPDWARYKGPILDAHELERLREKAREDAVVGVGKVYAKRPTTVEGELWRGGGDNVRVSMLGPQHVESGGSRSSTNKHAGHDPEVSRMRSREEEEEHKRRMREIYEKYGSVSRAHGGAGGSQRSEIDQPDVLRLG